MHMSSMLQRALHLVFTVEWYNLYSGGSYRDFQTKLYETTNVIELIYGSGANSGSSTYKGSIGISNSVGGTGNYVNGKNGSSTDSSYSSFPTSGTVYPVSYAICNSFLFNFLYYSLLSVLDDCAEISNELTISRFYLFLFYLEYTVYDSLHCNDSG